MDGLSCSVDGLLNDEYPESADIVEGLGAVSDNREPVAASSRIVCRRDFAAAIISLSLSV
ncbi:hypothetical protein M407DRAFT_243571 [Tulasnella calospora MUT 4182]|uniref:Uncharacterized protein n=1 Tax=Tulasnella calospora MUT 4182 TaxID=1051891 RepID=A0A0C3KZS3_9AGAM|nr:hypothetical protein M407DRAFT_243571 [Tulasnella calospora MUT 4182]